ncbi:MAG: alpha/beta hydrolase [Herminiimonas sp.]|nr:alpha/beta hydrolase [Herminiimonas sp.]MDB5855358.1 alpha/beta hydrolase [Herminiimonas sp.]
MTLLATVALGIVVLVGVMVAGAAIFTRRVVKRVETGMPPQGQFVEIGDVTFHVREQGEAQGPSILLIHGLGGQLQNFTYGVSGILARRFRVVSVDRPGSGYSVRTPSTAANISTQAAALAALVEKLDLGPTLVVGHSLGGAVALALAIEHPDCVDGIALVAPFTHLSDAEVPTAFRALTIATPLLRMLFAWTLAVPASIAGRRRVLDQVFGPEPVPRDFATRGGGLLGLRPSHFVAASMDLQAIPASMPGIEARYGELVIPISILFGKQDRILEPKENGEDFVTRVPGARLQLVDGGHMLPLTQPEVTARFIEEVANCLSEEAIRGVGG